MSEKAHIRICYENSTRTTCCSVEMQRSRMIWKGRCGVRCVFLELYMKKTINQSCWLLYFRVPIFFWLFLMFSVWCFYCYYNLELFTSFHILCFVAVVVTGDVVFVAGQTFLQLTATLFLLYLNGVFLIESKLSFYGPCQLILYPDSIP